jgi:acetyl-CoA acyltransferase
VQDAVIVSATRTPVGKAPNGSLRTVRPDDMAATVIREALRRAEGLKLADVEDVILGCAMPEGEQGLNVARIASLRAGVPVTASAVTVNRFCSSGLQAIAYAAERSCAASPTCGGWRHRVDEHGADGRQQAVAQSHARRQLSRRLPEYGLVAENHAREYGISREAQDAFALQSHQRAVAAIESGGSPRS